jgi:hypothetical protein
MRSRSLIYFFLVLFVACTGKPMHVLSDKKMENLLFDLYLAETEINDNPAVFRNDSARTQDFLQSVFRKHHTSQAKFDTSLVWYNAHMDRYLKINTQLTERYNRLIRQLETEAERLARALRKDSLRFEDLNLKDFVTPLLFSRLPETMAADSLPPDFVIPMLPVRKQEMAVDSIPADTLDTRPDTPEVSVQEDFVSIRRDTARRESIIHIRQDTNSPVRRMTEPSRR